MSVVGVGGAAMIPPMKPTILCLATLLLCPAATQADQTVPSQAPGDDRDTGVSSCERAISARTGSSSTEPSALGGGIVFDEHLLLDGSHERDADYNGGGELLLSGEHGGFVGRLLDRTLGSIDRVTCGLRSAQGDWHFTRALSAGLLVFTPNDLAAHGIVHGDRPYANLLFLSVGRRYTAPGADVAYDSTLTLGMLGLEAGAAMQRALHDLTNSTQPQGWSHQISAGGEPTVRYNFARQASLGTLGAGPWHADAKWTAAASLGTVTEASLAFNTRWGHIESPWWSFAPEERMYVQETQPVAPLLPEGASPEFFAFAGARFKLRAYNAFLQGQFRHSDLTYSEADVEQTLGEVWGGIELRTASGWQMQYVACWESPELRYGVGSRSFLWGSIEIAKSFR